MSKTASAAESRVLVERRKLNARTHRAGEPSGSSHRPPPLVIKSLR